MFEIDSLDIDDVSNLQSSYAVHKLDIGIYKVKMYLKRPYDSSKSYCEVICKVDRDSIHSKFQGVEINNILFTKPYTKNMDDEDTKKALNKFKMRWRTIFCSNYRSEVSPPFDYKKVIEKDVNEHQKYKKYLEHQKEKFLTGEVINCYIQIYAIDFTISGNSIYPKYSLNFIRNVHTQPEEVVTNTYSDYLDSFIANNKRIEYRTTDEPSQYMAFDETDLKKQNLLDLSISKRTAPAPSPAPSPTETVDMDSIEDIPF